MGMAAFTTTTTTSIITTAIRTVSLIRSLMEVDMLPVQMNCVTISHVFGVSGSMIISCLLSHVNSFVSKSNHRQANSIM